MSPQPLHVGVDATTWTLRRGFGRHARCLLSALVDVDRINRYTFFIDSPDIVPLLPPEAAAHVVEAKTPTTRAATADGPRRIADMLAMSRALSSSSLDVVLFPTMFSYVPTFGRARRILIVHDASAEMYPRLTLGGWKNRLLWSAKTRLGTWQAHDLVTVSEYSRGTIAAHLGVPADRLQVVGEASDPVFRRLADPVPSPRLRALSGNGRRRAIAYLGGFSPHKNVDMLIRVFGRLHAEPRFSDVDLYLVGDYEHESFVTCYQDLVRLVGELNLGQRVVFTGFLPDEELVVFLNLATVLALPSLTEGFGLPAVEAAACGCPVVATSESPLPALLGAAARFVDPRNEQSLERALRDILDSEDLQRSMRSAGLEAAARLSWPAAARRLASIIDGVQP